MNTIRKNLIGLLAATALILGAFSTGCTTTSQDNGDFDYMMKRAVAKTAIQYAALEFIGNDEQKADRVRKVTLAVMDALEGGKPVVVEMLVDAAMKEIDMKKLEPAQQVLVLNLVDLAQAAVVAQIAQTSPDLTESERWAVQGMNVRQVLMWVYDATQLHAMGARAE